MHWPFASGIDKTDSKILAAPRRWHLMQSQFQTIPILFKNHLQSADSCFCHHLPQQFYFFGREKTRQKT